MEANLEQKKDEAMNKFEETKKDLESSTQEGINKINEAVNGTREKIANFIDPEKDNK